MSTKDFFNNKLNDFSAIEKSDESWKGDVIFHYTKGVEAVRSILSGIIWATDMHDFQKDDENEGVLILKEDWK